MKSPVSILALSLLALAVPSFVAASGDSPVEAVSAVIVAPVSTAKVCMVTDRLFDKDQIPVEVSGRTYFGCCEMCKERLATDAGLRTATDPVSGKSVDKATAVIGARPDGSVLYFENRENLRKFAAGS